MVATDRSQLFARVEVPEAHEIDAWEWAIAMPYNCVFGQAVGLVMPASPLSIPVDYDNLDRLFRQQLAYYTSLQSFLTYSFGWTRQDKGLLWWLDAGYPDDDLRFALIKNIWMLDGTLNGYVAWCTTIDPKQAVSPLRRWATKPDLNPLPVPEKWAAEFRRAQFDGVWAGGSDPMHLGGGYHGGGASGALDALQPADIADNRLVGIDLGSRKATFIADGMKGWYAGLAELGGNLPPLTKDQSWHVDVYVRTIGFLGTYRRSRRTGLWFSGQHRYHLVGN